MDEEATQEQPTTPVEPTEQAQDQSAEQAIEQAATTLEKHLDTLVNDEHKLVVLAVRLAVKAGLYAGIGLMQPGDTRFAAIDVPSGQISWPIDESETALFEGVPLYDKPVELVSSDEHSRRLLAGL